MAGKFEITKDAEGRFRFWLKARNGTIIATSGEDYETMAGVKKAIASVRKNAPDAEEVDLTSRANRPAPPTEDPHAGPISRDRD